MNNLNVLVESLLIILGVGCFVAFLVGLGLLTVPRLVLHLNRMGDRWISTRRLTHFLSEPIDMDHWFFRHRRVGGGLLLIASGVIIAQLLFSYDSVRTVRYFSQYFNSEAVHLLERMMYLLLWVSGSIGFLLAGLLLFGKKEALFFMTKTNRWYSTRVATKFLEVPYHSSGPERLVSLHPRMLGVFLIVSSVYVAWIFLSLLK